MRIKLLFVAVVFVFIPVTAARPMTSLYAAQLDASMFEIGIITAMYSIIPLVVGVFAGRLIDKYGEKLPLFIGSLGILISLSLPFFFSGIPILYVSQFILGGSQFLAILAVQSGVTNGSSNKNRDKAVGSFTLFTSLGMLLGPLIGGYLSEHLGYRQTYILIALIPLVSIVLATFLSKNREISNRLLKDENSNSVKEILVDPKMNKSIFVSMIILSTLDFFYVYFPLYGKGLGLTPSQIGWILAAQSASSAVIRIFMPQIVTHLGRVSTLWVFMVVGACAYGTITFVNQFFFLFIVVIIFGAGLGIVQPLTIVLLYNVSPTQRTAEILGIRLVSNRLAQTIMPILFANLSVIIGLGSIFLINSVLLLSGALVSRGITDVNQVQQAKHNDNLYTNKHS